ncbi:MAG TPA: transposase [Acidobacteriota bacterium]
MEKLIGCFARHQRNLYDAPEFVLFGVARFGRNLDLLVKTESKDRLLERLAKLKIPCKTLRCRPFDPAGAHGHGFAAWLVAHYGLDGSDPGRRRVRVGQRRPVGNNYTYHVWNRTAHRRLLFGPVEKDMILETILSICRQKRVQLHAFVIMGNHFHLVVTTQNDVSISNLMQKIDWQITTEFNRMHQTTGALWQGPFKHTVWEPTAANLVFLINYVQANPLRAGLETEAGQYRWSSYGHYAGSARRKGLVVPLAIRRQHGKGGKREAWYREQFQQQYRCGKLQADARMKQTGFVGSKKFLKRIKQELAGPKRLPAFIKDMLKLKSQGAVWGLKTLLHLLCKPMVDDSLKAHNCWKNLADRIGPLVPVPEPSG